jgi:hypothetical protein
MQMQNKCLSVMSRHLGSSSALRFDAPTSKKLPPPPLLLLLLMKRRSISIQDSRFDIDFDTTFAV